MPTPDVDIPSSYTITTHNHFPDTISIDPGLDDIRIKEFPINELKSKVDLGLDNIRIKEIPRIDLQLEFGMKPTRVHFPVDLKLGLSVLGIEVLNLAVCGESMIIIEKYIPHKAEVCD